MKKNFLKQLTIFFSILTIASLACGAPAHASPAEQINLETGQVVLTVMPGNDSGGTVTIISPIFQRYDECISKAIQADPSAYVTELTGNDETVDVQKFWWCGDGEVGKDDVVFLSLAAMTSVTPIPDDVIVVGSAIAYNAAKETIKLVAVLASSYIVGRVASDYIYMHSNRDHSPNVNGTLARRVIESFILAWTNFSNGNGQDPRNNCGVVKDAAGNIIKVAFTFLDDATGKFYVLWYWAKTGGTPWGGAYPKEPTGKGSFEEGPKDLKDGWTWTTGSDICSGVGNYIPRLQPAQP